MSLRVLALTVRHGETFYAIVNFSRIARDSSIERLEAELDAKTIRRLAASLTCIADDLDAQTEALGVLSETGPFE